MFDARRQRARQPDSPHVRRKYALRQYGIGQEDYSMLYAAQHGRCAVCAVFKEPWVPTGVAGRSKYLVVDHDHSTGHIRGLLCTNCNIAIGQMHDNPIIVRAAAAYLEQFDNSM
jgi:hypothetical protein